MSLMFFVGGVVEEKAGCLQNRGYWTNERGRPYINATGFLQIAQAAKTQGDLTIPCEDIASIFRIPWLPDTVGVNIVRIQGCSGLCGKEFTDAQITGMQQITNAMAFLKKHLPGFENAYLISSAPEIGVQPICMAIGEAAGVAAALCTVDGILPPHSYPHGCKKR